MQAAQILIIEDDADIRESLTDFLSLEDFTVATASNGQEGLEYLAAHKNTLPSLIFLDLMMPVMDGRTFLEKINTQFPDFDIPIIVFSAVPDAKLNYPITAFMRKPVDLDDLTLKTRQFVGMNDASAAV